MGDFQGTFGCQGFRYRLLSALLMLAWRVNNGGSRGQHTSTESCSGTRFVTRLLVVFPFV